MEARLVTMAGPDTQVFFASDHGFTASTFVLRINTFLGEKGVPSQLRVPDVDGGP